ncbi:hypothetical protein [Nocardioides aquiterrae]|uniref:Cell wall protein n=1 Tax=Nocardioides aquiterrae TaxID=203799 RepID=A0ABP4EXU6_9ACTN
MRRSPTRFRPAPALAAIAALGIVSLALAFPAYAGLTLDSADCQGEIMVNGDDGTDTTITQDTDRATVDPSGSYSGTGSINGGKGHKKRSYSGSLEIDLPAPLPDYGPSSWSWSDDASRTYATTEPKTGTYDLPGFVPRGFYVPLVATHAENGEKVCAYAGEIKVSGSFADSPVSLAAAAGTLLFGALATLAGVSRRAV